MVKFIDMERLFYGVCQSDLCSFVWAMCLYLFEQHINLILKIERSEDDGFDTTTEVLSLLAHDLVMISLDSSFFYYVTWAPSNFH